MALISHLCKVALNGGFFHNSNFNFHGQEKGEYFA